MKYENIFFKIEEVKITANTYTYDFISYINPVIDFILSFEISKNNNIKTIQNNTIFISFDNENNLKFKIKNVYAEICAPFIEFEKRMDNSFEFKFFENEEQKKKIDIFIDIEKYKSFPKMYELFNNNIIKLKDFLFNSFCKYLFNIVSYYPESDGVYIYKKIVNYLLNVNTFAINDESDKNIEKISINYFKEEKYEKSLIKNDIIFYINIETKFDIIFRNTTKTKSYSEIIPKIKFEPIIFTFEGNNCTIGNSSLKKIFENLFNDFVLLYYKNESQIFDI